MIILKQTSDLCVNLKYISLCHCPKNQSKIFVSNIVESLKKREMITFLTILAYLTDRYLN